MQRRGFLGSLGGFLSFTAFERKCLAESGLKSPTSLQQDVKYWGLLLDNDYLAICYDRNYLETVKMHAIYDYLEQRCLNSTYYLSSLKSNTEQLRTIQKICPQLLKKVKINTEPECLIRITNSNNLVGLDGYLKITNNQVYIDRLHVRFLANKNVIPGQHVKSKSNMCKNGDWAGIVEKIYEDQYTYERNTDFHLSLEMKQKLAKELVDFKMFKIEELKEIRPGRLDNDTPLLQPNQKIPHFNF